VTINIAIKYFPQKIMGIDIDYKLINKALGHVHFFQKQQAASKPSELPKEKVQKVNEKEKKLNEILQKIQSFPKSFSINYALPQALLNKIKDYDLLQNPL